MSSHQHNYGLVEVTLVGDEDHEPHSDPRLIRIADVAAEVARKTVVSNSSTEYGLQCIAIQNRIFSLGALQKLDVYLDNSPYPFVFEGLEQPHEKLRIKKHDATKIIAYHTTGFTETLDAEPGSAGFTQRSRKRTTDSWWELSKEYIAQTFAQGKHASMRSLFRALLLKAGQESPFDKGIGDERGKLYHEETGKHIAERTLGNKGSEIRELAKKFHSVKRVKPVKE